MKTVTFLVFLTSMFLGGCVNLQPYYDSVNVATRARADVVIKAAEAKKAEASAAEKNTLALQAALLSKEVDPATKAEIARQLGLTQLVTNIVGAVAGQKSDGNASAILNPPPPPQPDYLAAGLSLIKEGLWAWRAISGDRNNKDIAIATLQSNERRDQAQRDTYLGLASYTGTTASDIVRAMADRPPSVNINAGGSVVTGGAGSAYGSNAGSNSGNSGAIGTGNRQNSANACNGGNSGQAGNGATAAGGASGPGGSPSC